MTAIVVALSLAVASCTGGDDASSSTTLADEPSTTEQPRTDTVSLEQVLGEYQPVQDFLIHLDMATGFEQNPNSFYDDVLAESRTGAQATQELAGGFRFTPVQSLHGTVVDAGGDALPSLSVDYALLDPGPERLAAAQADLIDAVDALDPEGRAQWSEFMDQVDDGQPELLVEIVTADPLGGRVHVGPGDLAALDLTFVSSLAPGDRVTSTYLFGQTLPGDPTSEAGLSAHELFVHRWDQGLISMLGGPDGVEVIVDPAVTLVDGSTIRRQEVKQFMALASYVEGFYEGAQEADDLLAGRSDTIAIGNVRLSSAGSNAYADKKVIVIRDEGPDKNFVFIYPDDFSEVLGVLRGLERCAETVATLMERNQPTANQPTGDAAVIATVAEHGLEGLADETTTTDPSDTSTPEGSGSEPMSCSPPPEPSQLPKLPTGIASGDAHVITIDGASSANQAVGEFLLFDNGTAEIQMRTARWGDGEILQVSFPTAFAARLGEHSMSVHPDGDVWIDGKLVEIKRGETIVIGDAEVMQWPDGIAVVWPDGTLAEFRLFETRGMVMVTPSRTPAVGLLGNNDGDPDNDFFTRSGEQLERDVEKDFERFYGTYVDSWRLSDDESHFHYREGETTATFTLEGFPAARTTIDDLPVDARTRAEAVCRSVGINHVDVFEDCVFDVGATGDPTFATEAFIAQHALAQSSEADDRSENTDGAPVNELTIADLTIELGPDPPSQMPNGPTTAWTCRSDAGVFSVSGRLFETSSRSYEYTIEYISPDNPRGLPERFTLSVTRSGESFAWVQTNAEIFADAVRTVSMNENSLIVEGELYLNDPPVDGRFLGGALPDDVPLQRFTLITTCTE